MQHCQVVRSSWVLSEESHAAPLQASMWGIVGALFCPMPFSVPSASPQITTHEPLLISGNYCYASWVFVDEQISCLGEILPSIRASLYPVWNIKNNTVNTAGEPRHWSSWRTAFLSFSFYLNLVALLLWSFTWSVLKMLHQKTSKRRKVQNDCPPQVWRLACWEYHSYILFSKVMGTLHLNSSISVILKLYVWCVSI